MVPVAAAADLSLLAYGDVAAGCTRCALAATRTQVVFGSGSPTADLMFVGEAPGFHEDKQGVPFVGAAGKLLGKLLDGIGLTRDDVYVANCLMCRPPGNRDPQPAEIESCEPHLWKQIELIQPRLIATLGNFATKLLSGKPNGITQVHGREQQVVLGGTRSPCIRSFIRRRRSTPRACSQVLEEDFARIPALIGRVVEPPPVALVQTVVPLEQPTQLGLF